MSVIEAEVQPAIETAVQAGFDYGQVDEGIRDEVKQAARSIRQLEQGIITGIVAIGKRLIEVKDMLDHGVFEAWIAGEFGMGPRLAQHMMNLARECADPQKRKTYTLFSPSVAYIVAAPSYPDEAWVEVEQAAAAGERVTVEFAKEAKVKHAPPVERVRAPRPTPAPQPAREVYGAPKPEPVAKAEPVQPPIEFPFMPHDLDAMGFAFARVGDRMWMIYRAEDTYQSNWHHGPADCIADARQYLAEIDAAVEEAEQERDIVDDLLDAAAQGGIATVQRLDPVVGLLIDPLTPESTLAPGGLHHTLRHATVEQAQEALRRLPDELRRGRGPVLEAALKRLGAKPDPARELPAVVTPETPVEVETPPDLVVAGYTMLRVGEAWGWIRQGVEKVDRYRGFPVGEVITGYRGGHPFADAKTAIEEARRDMLTDMKIGPTKDYYPVKGGPPVMHADLAAAGYELLGGDGDEPADGKHGYRWRKGDQLGPNVAYGGAAIEGARAHYAAALAYAAPTPPASKPSVHTLSQTEWINREVDAYEREAKAEVEQIVSEHTLTISRHLLEALHTDLMTDYPRRLLAPGQRHTLAGIIYRALGGEVQP